MRGSGNIQIQYETTRNSLTLQTFDIRDTINAAALHFAESGLYIFKFRFAKVLVTFNGF